MADPRRAKLLAQLMEFIDGLDGEDLAAMAKPAEKSVDVAIVAPGAMPGDTDKDGDCETGPMEKLVAAKDGGAPQDKVPEAMPGDQDEVSDEDFEDLLKQAQD